MDQVVRSFLVLCLAVVGSAYYQELPVNYNARSTAGAGAGMCPDAQNLTESIGQAIRSLINSDILPTLVPVFGTGPGHGACGCGGTGWRRAVYFNMSDPKQTCPPAWHLITTPRRTCTRPPSAGSFSCYSAMFPTRGIQYTQVCGRIIGYQIGQAGAFFFENRVRPTSIGEYYVDGVSLTYGNPRKHIWTFANGLDESMRLTLHQCPCTLYGRIPTNIPSFIGNDYFCETGFPPDQQYMYSYFNETAFNADDPLWDGHGCGSTGACECTLNNPPWFCKQLPQSTNADLEVRLCLGGTPAIENTAVELIEIYIK